MMNLSSIIKGISVGATVGTSLGFMEILKWKIGDTIPAASVVVSKQAGTARVGVSGDLKSGGDTTIDAKSTLVADLNSAAAINNFDKEAPFTAAVLWAELNNNAGVTIANDKTVTAGGALSVSSGVTNSIKTKATASVPAHAPGSAALNATFVTTAAETAIGDKARLTAGGAVTIKASNETTDWTAKATNTSSTAPLLGAAIKANLTMPAYKAIYSRLATKLNIPESMRYGNGAGENNFSSEWGFSVLYTGTDISASGPSQKSTVSIGKNAKIVTPANVSISSDLLVNDFQWSSTSRVGGNDLTSKDLTNTFSFAITYDNASLDSSVKFGEGAQVLAGGSIDVESGVLSGTVCGERSTRSKKTGKS